MNRKNRVVLGLLKYLSIISLFVGILKFNPIVIILGIFSTLVYLDEKEKYEEK